MGGCSWFQSVATPPNINLVTYNASYYGLKDILNNNPGRAAQICQDVTTGVNAVNTVFLNAPNGLLAGGTGSQVLAGALQTAMTQLDGLLPANAVGPVNLGLVVIESMVQIPGLPTATLSSQTVTDLNAGLQGLTKGLTQQVADWQAAHPAPTPAPAPAPVAAAKAPVKAHLVNIWKR
jgi:hypothetical protein